MKKGGRKVTAMLLAAALTVSGLPGLLAAEAEAAPLETDGLTSVATVLPDAATVFVSKSGCAWKTMALSANAVVFC